MLVDAERVLALFAVADTVKETSRAAIAELQRLGVSTAMLTGDNPHTAAAIAQQVGIDEARGNQLPEDKLNAVAQWSNDGATVGMVGDGINDAPALARADIGFAMGAMGTDTAIETADVALMDDDLRKIPSFIRLSKATHSVLVQNITLGARHQERLPRVGRDRSRHDVDGRVRRCGRESAGGGERAAAVAPVDGAAVLWFDEGRREMGFWEKMLGGHHGGGRHGGGHGGSHDAWGRDNRHGSYDDQSGHGMPPSASSSTGAPCPQCRAANAQGARFCQQCGTSLMPATCGTCRASISPGAKFCQQCGAATQV